MARVTKDMVRAEAYRIVEFYSASVRVTDKSVVKRGQKEHSGGGSSKGWWVDCQVFVPRHNFD